MLRKLFLILVIIVITCNVYSSTRGLRYYKQFKVLLNKYKKNEIPQKFQLSLDLNLDSSLVWLVSRSESETVNNSFVNIFREVVSDKRTTNFLRLFGVEPNISFFFSIDENHLKIVIFWKTTNDEKAEELCKTYRKLIKLYYKPENNLSKMISRYFRSYPIDSQVNVEWYIPKEKGLKILSNL